MKIEFINPDENFPLIWDIKNRVYKNFGIPIDSQLLYNGSGIQVTDTVAFSNCQEMLQPFRLKTATARVKLIISVFSVSSKKTPLSSKSSSSSLCLETYGSSSVFNLYKHIERTFSISSKNLVFYFLNKQMDPTKSLVEYGIYDDKEDIYRI